MTVQWTSHSQMVMELAKPGQAITESLTPSKAHVWHMTSCLMGEAGELLEGINRFDKSNIIEELGDLEFYMEGLRIELKFNRSAVIAAMANLTVLDVIIPSYLTGILIESCNIFDACKKWIIYEKDLDRGVLLLALARFEWYMSAFRARYSIDYENTIAGNMEKLGKRYSAGSYSNEAAQERRDKK